VSLGGTNGNDGLDGDGNGFSSSVFNYDGYFFDGPHDWYIADNLIYEADEFIPL